MFECLFMHCGIALYSVKTSFSLKPLVNVKKYVKAHKS